MADGDTFCKCGTPSTGPTKSGANSFTIAACDGLEPVQIPAANFADYIINVIYGDTEGDPPAEGCYSVCYDALGNRSITGNQDAGLSDYELQEIVTIFPDAPADPDDYEWWGRTTTRIIPLVQPPTGYIPTHVKLRIWSVTKGSGETMVLRDTNANRIFFMQGFEADDDHSSVTDVLVPVQQDVFGNYEVYITGDYSDDRSYANIKQVGYSQVNTFDIDGNVTPPTGGDTPVEPPAPVTPTPLEITYLNHTYNVAGADTTIIEWFIDNDLVGTDEYSVHIDMGESIHVETVTHVVGITSLKQRLTINWSALDNLKVDAVIQEATYGSVKTSNFGVSDATIPVSYQSTVAV